MSLFFLGLGLGLLVGAVLVFFIRQSKIASLRERLVGFQGLLESEKATKEKLQNEFKLAASESLRQTAEQFLVTAMKDLRQASTEAGQGISNDKKEIERVATEMKSRLEEYQKTLKKSEEDRLLMQGEITKSLSQVFEAEQSIRMETSSLKRALTSNSGVRGSLGEMVLQQMLEDNGLVKGIGFDTQVSLTDESNNDFRPDFVVHLPGDRRLVIDSKEMTAEYALAQECEDEDSRKSHYQKLVQNIRNNFNRLSRKEYQTQMDPEIPFVVMFVSNEGAIRAAFSADPTLYREALEKKVFLASPMTLIPLLQLVKYGWQQYRLAGNARELGGIVEELGNRLFTFMNHLKNMRDGIQKTSDAWDGAVRSWESRIFPQLQRAKEAGAKLKDSEPFTSLDTKLRSVESPTAKKS